MELKGTRVKLSVEYTLWLAWLTWFLPASLFT